MICTFFGHREVYESIGELLKREILRLYYHDQASEFYIGNKGSFDAIVQRICAEIAEAHSEFSYSVVLSRPNERPLCTAARETFFPQELDSVPPRFAVSKRNDWMLKHASVLIAYQRHRFSNTERYVKLARKRGLTVIDI